MESEHHGLYGDTSAYYGTVEQQGRLALHLHMLLWLHGNLNPQEIRKRIMDPESDWQKKMVKYLESTHIGEFMTGSQTQVLETVNNNEKISNYIDPTMTLPEEPPLPWERRRM